jgi:hypothetical protein
MKYEADSERRNGLLCGLSAICLEEKRETEKAEEALIQKPPEKLSLPQKSQLNVTVASRYIYISLPSLHFGPQRSDSETYRRWPLY